METIREQAARLKAAVDAAADPAEREKAELELDAFYDWLDDDYYTAGVKE